MSAISATGTCVQEYIKHIACLGQIKRAAIHKVSRLRHSSVCVCVLCNQSWQPKQSSRSSAVLCPLSSRWEHLHLAAPMLQLPN